MVIVLEYQYAIIYLLKLYEENYINVDEVTLKTQLALKQSTCNKLL